MNQPSHSHPHPPPAADYAVVARGLTKVFTDLWGRPKARAVDGVDFEIKRGEVFGLLGPNGSGKSTTIKMLLGLLYPSAGHIEVLGRSPRDVATKERIGYLPEESYLYRHLTAAETLDFYGHIFALPAADRRLRSRQLLDMVGLAGAGSRRVGEFSKGMQRRLGLAQALLNDPELVILDEPTAGLDPLGCREVKDVILALARRGKTILLCSHLLADVEDVCDRVVIYYGGRIQSAGPLHELLARPDALRFTTPALSRPLVEEILSLMRREAPADLVRVETPTRNLEGYFLDVVRRARGAARQTSGATSGGPVAGYLQAEDQETQPDRLLERLTQPAPEPTPPDPAPVPTPLEPLLDHLTRPESPARQNPLPAPPPAPDPDDTAALQEAERKLSTLISPANPPQ